jgi:hypothetical protein
MKRSYDELLFTQNFLDGFFLESSVKACFLYNFNYFVIKILND